MAAFVLTIGEDDHGFAADFGLQLLIGGKKDRVVEGCAAGTGIGNRSSAQARQSAASTAAADLQLVQGARQVTGIIGIVLVKVNVGVEVDEECQVLAAQHVVQEFGTGFLLDGQHARLAGARVNQDPQCKRLV